MEEKRRGPAEQAAESAGASADTPGGNGGAAEQGDSELDATLAKMAAEKEGGGREDEAALFLSGSAEFEKMRHLPEEGGSAAPWVLTFADLMSLLLCFFILLFAMAELDVKKFSDVAQALAGALGGGKVIYIRDPGTMASEVKSTAFIRESQERIETEYYARELRKELAEEIRQKKLKVEEEGQIITIHILQNGSFAAGSASLDPAFLPTARKIRDALVDIPGNLTVAGHTDNHPIGNGRFLSNWELSGARAFAVIHELLKGGVLPAKRFVLTGHADTQPRAANDSEENRAKNRRVEIVIDQRKQAGEEQASYEFLRQNLSPEVIRGNIEVQSSR